MHPGDEDIYEFVVAQLADVDLTVPCTRGHVTMLRMCVVDTIKNMTENPFYLRALIILLKYGAGKRPQKEISAIYDAVMTTLSGERDAEPVLRLLVKAGVRVTPETIEQYEPDDPYRHILTPEYVMEHAEWEHSDIDMLNFAIRTNLVERMPLLLRDASEEVLHNAYIAAVWYGRPHLAKLILDTVEDSAALEMANFLREIHKAKDWRRFWSKPRGVYEALETVYATSEVGGTRDLALARWQQRQMPVADAVVKETDLKNAGNKRVFAALGLLSGLKGMSDELRAFTDPITPVPTPSTRHPRRVIPKT